MTIDSSPGAVPEWTLGWRMQRALSHAGLSIELMAEEFGVARSTISRWVNDKGPVRQIYLRQWALRTGVSFDWLETGHAVPPPGGPPRTLEDAMADANGHARPRGGVRTLD